MAQADYVTNAVRALITGAGTEPSTNLVRTAHAEFVAARSGATALANSDFRRRN